MVSHNRLYIPVLTHHTKNEDPMRRSATTASISQVCAKPQQYYWWQQSKMFGDLYISYCSYTFLIMCELAQKWKWNLLPSNQVLKGVFSNLPAMLDGAAVTLYDFCPQRNLLKSQRGVHLNSKDVSYSFPTFPKEQWHNAFICTYSLLPTPCSLSIQAYLPISLRTIWILHFKKFTE